VNAPLNLPPPVNAHARVAAPGASGASVASGASMTLAPWGSDVKKILCVRLDNLGDVLMSTPAMRALRAASTGRRLTLLASSAGSALAPHLTDVDDVIQYDAPWHFSLAGHTHADDLRMRERLSEHQFDAAVIFTVYSQNPLPAAMLCYLAGIPRRLAHCRENPYCLLTDWVREPEPQQQTRHEVERQLALVGQVGARTSDTALRFAVSERDRASLDGRLAAEGIDPARPYLVLHPGASAASRRYPAARFGEVAARLAEATGYPLLLTGAASERPLTAQVMRAANAVRSTALHDFAGALTLGEFAALIEHASVLVTNNSGPAHLACALRTPVVDLYALTNPQHGPWQTPHRVLFHDVECRWCYRSVCPQQHHACLLGVTPREVVQATLDLLAETQAPREARAGAQAASTC
jgi:lipopolysaccharide heptosyltransferase II